MKSKSFGSIKIYSLFISIAFLSFILADLFNIAVFQYIDELVEILCILWLVYSTIHKRNYIPLILLILLFIVGVAGNILSRYKISLINIILDYLLILKFPIIFISVFDFIQTEKIKIDEFLPFFTLVSVLCSVLVFICCLYRFVLSGGEQVGFLNSNYQGYAGLYGFAFSLIIYKNKLIRKWLRILIFMLNFITAAFFCKSSASTVLFIALFGAEFYLNFIKPKVKGNFLIYIGIILGLILILNLFGYKIERYFITVDEAPRKLFLVNAFKLANQYKGFGVGFGLYGGNIAANNYSPVYYALGFNNIWTVAEGSAYLLDSFFPTIVGELGYIGTFLYLLLIISCIKKLKRNKLLYFIFIIIMLGGFTANFINSSCGVTMILGLNIIYFTNPKTHKKNEFIKLMNLPKNSYIYSKL